MDLRSPAQLVGYVALVLGVFGFLTCRSSELTFRLRAGRHDHSLGGFMRPTLLAVTLLVGGCVTAAPTTAALDPNVQQEPEPSRATPPAFDRANCTFNGHPLYGKIKVVDALADVKVEVVSAFPDLRVEKVEAFPDACGRWEMVDALADTTIEFVTAFPDVKVEFVSAFPGIR